ncbi:MAG: helix-turn-helix domain-containing protein [Clostridiales bacterium]|nr:helix-turn-helix domain-containing protein [Clostridiales bacterium]
MAANCNFDCFRCKFPDCRNSKVDGVTLAREKKLHGYRDPADRRKEKQRQRSLRRSELRYEKATRYGEACRPIRERRKLMGLTQEELGKLIGRSPGTICGWERGNVRPDLALLETVMPGITAEVEPLPAAAGKGKNHDLHQ